MTAARSWGLLAVQPIGSLAYLWSLRQQWLTPSFLPVLALSGVPVAVLATSLRPPRRAAVAGIALVEIGWAVLAEAMVGFAIAWRSG